MDPLSARSALRSDLTSVPTSPRLTPTDGTAFRDVVGRGAQVLAAEAQNAVVRLPGGPLLAAAVRPVASGVAPHVGSGLVAGAPSPAASGSTAEGPGAPGTTSAAGASVESQLASSQDMNLYYLQLQEAMAAENRQYSAASNVLKARHDTVKNAIGNIR